MKSGLNIVLNDQELLLLPEKACYWKSENTLLLSDMHLGKIAHFRKHGIPLPLALAENELERLSKLIAETKAERLLVLGDMFHSSDNGEVFMFELWRAHFPALHICLIEGNHDILEKERYQELQIECLPELIEKGFRFSHHPPDKSKTDLYGIHGHLHPGINIKGAGKQNLRLPCFWAGPDYALMPAFGAFTGLSSPPDAPKAGIYLFSPKEVIRWN